MVFELQVAQYPGCKVGGGKLDVFVVPEWEEVNIKLREALPSLFARSLHPLWGRMPTVAVVLRLHQRLQWHLEIVAISSLYPLAFLTLIGLSMLIISCDHMDMDLPLPNALL